MIKNQVVTYSLQFLILLKDRLHLNVIHNTGIKALESYLTTCSNNLNDQKQILNYSAKMWQTFFTPSFTLHSPHVINLYTTHLFPNGLNLFLQNQCSGKCLKFILQWMLKQSVFIFPSSSLFFYHAAKVFFINHKSDFNKFPHKSLLIPL